MGGNTAIGTRPLNPHGIDDLEVARASAVAHQNRTTHVDDLTRPEERGRDLERTTLGHAGRQPKGRRNAAERDDDRDERGEDGTNHDRLLRDRSHRSIS